MRKYLCLLRGINVSGQKKIIMKDLKELFERLGFTSVVTYIQSGNVIFSSSEEDKRILQEKIIKNILNSFGFEVGVILKIQDELKQLISECQFLEKEQNKVYFTFFFSEVKEYSLDLISNKKSDFEIYNISISYVCLYCPKGYGITKLTNTFFEKVMKTQATTRNLRTVLKLIEMME